MMNNENLNQNHIQDDPEFKEIWDLAGSYKFKEAEGNDACECERDFCCLD